MEFLMGVFAGTVLGTGVLAIISANKAVDDYERGWQDCEETAMDNYQRGWDEREEANIDDYQRGWDDCEQQMLTEFDKS